MEHSASGVQSSVWPKTRCQRDWFHELGNVLDALPTRLQGKAKSKLREAMYASTRKDAEEALDAFEKEFGAKYPKAVEKITKEGP